jgi:colanic acid/amylovoran biosynthesis glycosyltransferase
MMKIRKRKVSLIVPAYSEKTHIWISLHAIGLIEAGWDVEIICQRFIGLSHEIEMKYGLQDKVIEIFPTNNIFLLIMKSLFCISNFRDIHHLLKNLFNKTNFYKCAESLLYRKFFRNRDFDIVHAHFGSRGVLIAKMISQKILTYNRFACTFHGADIENQQRDYSPVFSVADKIVTNSEYSKKKLIKRGCVAKKIAIVPSMYNNLEIGVKEAHNNGFPSVFFVGRLVEYKGIEEAIEIVKLVNQRLGKKINFNVFGGGPLEDLVRQNEDHLNYFGPRTQKEIFSYFKKGDIFLYPSKKDRNGREENQGVVLLEAQAAGLIPVTSFTGGIPEYIINEQTGFVIPPGANPLYVEHILELIKDSLKRSTMAEAAIKNASNYTINKLTRQMIGSVYY